MKQDALWDFFQNEARESFVGNRGRLAYLAGKVTERAEVLNIGVGDGALEGMLGRRATVYSLDPSEKAIDRLRAEHGMGSRAKSGRIEAIPWPDETFDFVVASEVLEHLSDDVFAAGLSEIRRVLRKRGVFLGTVPAREDLKAAEVLCPECSAKFHRWGHVRSFNKESLRESLQGTFAETEVVERPLIAWGAYSLKGKLGAAAKMLLWRAGTHGSGEFVCFVARKRS